MRTTRTVRSVLAGLVVLGAAAAASAQTAPPETAPPTEIGGFRIDGYGEAGVRFFIERPSDKQNGKFEEYRDFNEGLFLQSLRLRFFTPDEKYSGEFGGRQWGMQDQEFHLSFERLGRWEAGFEWDQMRHVFGESPLQQFLTYPERNVVTLPNPRPAFGFYNSNLGNVEEVSVRWDTARTFFKFSPSENTDVFADYTRIYKHGYRPFGMAFGSPGGNAFEILQPIEQTIHDFRLRGTWATEKLATPGRLHDVDLRERLLLGASRQPLPARRRSLSPLRGRRRRQHQAVRHHLAPAEQHGPHLQPAGRGEPALAHAHQQQLHLQPEAPERGLPAPDEHQQSPRVESEPGPAAEEPERQRPDVPVQRQRDQPAAARSRHLRGQVPAVQPHGRE